eukprot:GHVS01027053.1.p1 GENE.GHVS01027053.1~~GHVS01027053.1.p1  ORF type:complete len:205 (+),score=28.31 GHVS01027053.1:235-849(+)
MTNSMSRFDKCVYGTSIVGVVCALCYHDLQSFSWLFRPLLNASWGFLFGSSVWVALIQRHLVLKQLPHNEACRVGCVIFPTLFKAGTLCSSVLFLCTAGLAPNSPLLLRSSLLCWSLSLFNSAYVTPRAIAEQNQPMLLMEQQQQTASSGGDTKELIRSGDGSRQTEVDEDLLKPLRKNQKYYLLMSRLAGYTSLLTLVPYALL